MKLGIIIIDDEADAIEALEGIIEMNTKEYRILAKTNNSMEGLGLILKHKPDLVFLDIEMPGMNGFELLESIQEINFEIIFATAYEHYAIKAIKSNAIDYILKPFSVHEVLNALAKVKNKIKALETNTNKYKNLLIDLNAPSKNRITIPTIRGFEIIELDDLIYLEADGSYTTAYFSLSEKLVISKAIKSIEPLLDKKTFFRTHRSYIVNNMYIKRFDRENNKIILKNKEQIPLSRRRYDDFMIFIKEQSL